MQSRASFPWRGGPAAVQPLVLVVADEHERQRSLASVLAVHGFRCLQAGAGTAGLARALGHSPDLVLVEAVEPGVDRVSVTGRLRDGTAAPILVVLSSPGEGGDALLDAGANDYIVRPFAPAELITRIRVWLRQGTRAMPSTGAPVPSRGGAPRLRIDREHRAIFVEGRRLHVTPLEYKLVTVLAQSPSRGVPERGLFEAVWGYGAEPAPQYLRALVRQVRQKIERDPQRPAHLVSIAGGGYRLELG